MESSKISIPSASHLAVCMQHICTQKQIKVTMAELLQICSIIYIRDTAYCTSPPPISIRNRHAFSLRFYKTSAVHPIGSQADQMEGQVQDMGKGSQIVDSNLVLPHLSNELPGKTTLGYVEAWSAALQGRPVLVGSSLSRRCVAQGWAVCATPLASAAPATLPPLPAAHTNVPLEKLRAFYCHLWSEILNHRSAYSFLVI